MRFKIMNHKSLALSLLTMSALPLSALATPSSTSPYIADPQNSYVQDQTSEGLSNLNTVLCIMDSIKPADMVNKGNYVALVDMNKCDSSHQTSTSDSTAGSSGATSTPNYMTAVVNVTRASNSDPMVGKMWMSMTEEGKQQKIFVHLTATQSPTDAPPYGVFRVDYLGQDASSGVTGFNGFVDASGANISSLESDSNGGGSGTNALALNATDTTSGSGTMDVMDYSGSSPTQKTFNFAYDSDETANGFPNGIFRRSDGTNEACFDRSKSASHKSVWRYGTYNDSDGSRVDQAHPGFPIQASYNGTTYWGYASYWGVNFQGLDINSFADGALSGVTITDQRPGNNTQYTLSKNSGKLTKWTQNTSTLTAMDGVPFTFWGNLQNQTDDSSGTINAATFGSWEMHWDNANSRFVVTGSQVCNNGPCTLNALPTPANVTGTIFDTNPIQGWSQSFGGNINIPANGSAHGGVDEVDYYTQSDVIPGSAALTLHCLSNCPTAAAMVNFNGGSAASPFDPTTATQWNSGSVSINYTFDGTGLVDSAASPGPTPLAGIITDATKFAGMYQNGVQSGRLFDTALPTTGCPNSGTVCEPGNPTVYYTWATGPNQWNQSMWLTNTSDNSVVSFDPPENISYPVPSGAEYGTWAGKTIQLQFNGFGNLQGIPGSCVDPQTNSEVPCGPGTRYVPAFSIADGETMTLTRPSGNITLKVKALDAEVRLNNVSCASVSAQLPASPLTLPTTADLHDPSNSSDAYYNGIEPTVTDAPKVIDGVIQ
jgi:hypothetical protein